MFLMVTGMSETQPPQAPRAAMVFNRTDHEVTRVRIGKAPKSAHRIDPRVFSNFLEHLGGSIYEALWANVVYNPHFEAERDGNLARWRLDRSEWIGDGLQGRAVRMPDGASVSQPIGLPAHRQLRYRGSIWTRSFGSKLAIIEVAVFRPGESEPIASARVRVEGTRWEPRRFELRLPEGRVRRAEALELRIRAASGEADIDMVEIYPSDARDGFDPEVVTIAKSLRMRLLRWPGGNFVSGYRWRNGVGPREQRPTVPNPAWRGLETHHFGTDEFMEFCRRVGSEPMICVNAGDGSPEEAAAWVEYCNGSTDTAMGALRASNGHIKPYNVRVWEIGNELYGSWQIGHTDAAGNARRFVEFRKAMLAADPSIEIIATGKGDQFVGPGIQGDRAWNEAVLDAARADGSPPHYLSVHPLLPLPSGLGASHSYEDIYLSAMAHPKWWSDTLVPAIAELLAAHGGNPKPRLAVTEWGIIVGGNDWQQYASHDSQSGAVYAALFLHALLRSFDTVAIANATALMHGGCIRKARGAVYVMPMIHAKRMYGQALLDKPSPVTVSGPAYDVPRRGLMPEVTNVPWVDAFAAESGGRLTVCLVNRDMGSSRKVEIELPRTYDTAIGETLAADARATNSVSEPDRVAPVRITPRLEGLTASIDLPACSVTVISLRQETQHPGKRDISL